MSDLFDDTVAGQIAETLAEEIVRGKRRPGERLRQELIAESFGASHVPVREAFLRLQAKGLAVALPRRGVRVASIDYKQAKEVALIRANLEGMALEFAFPNHTKRTWSEAEKATESGEQAANIYDWQAANRAFHRVILAPCRMPKLMKMIDDLHMDGARFLFSAQEKEWKPNPDKDHRSILAALRKGDLDAAVRRLKRHVGTIKPI